MNKVSGKTLEKIKQEKVTPKPRWRFLMRDTFIWLLFVLMVIIGSLAFNVILFLIKNADLDLYGKIGRSPFSHLMMSLPYLWIIIFLLAFLIALYSFRYSKRGYKYKIFVIILFCILFCGVFGIIIFFTKSGQITHSLMINSIPTYQRISHQGMMWNRPERGMLAGRIVEVENDAIFILDDLEREYWEVMYLEAKIPPKMKLEEGIMVKVIGEQTGEDTFKAEGIRPWIGIEINNGRNGNNMNRSHIRIEMKEIQEPSRIN